MIRARIEVDGPDWQVTAHRLRELAHEMSMGRSYLEAEEAGSDGTVYQLLVEEIDD